MEDVTRACVALLCLVLIRSAQTLGSPGIMQMQVEGFYNTHGRDSAGRCCSLPANSTARTPLLCPGTCRTFFRVCAAKVGPNWPDEPDLRQNTLACPLGLLVTPPIANNSLDPQQDGVLIMRFPYREWPGKVKIVLEAWHDVTGSLFEQDPRVSLGAENVARLIMRIERRHRLSLNEDWLRRTVHITVPNGESSRRPVRRISVTYALRIVPIPKPTSPPTTTTEATKENNEMSTLLAPETTVMPVDKEAQQEDISDATKIILNNETGENESEFMTTILPPIEMEVTMPYNLTEDLQITNSFSTESESIEDITDETDMMTPTVGTGFTNPPEMFTESNSMDISDENDGVDVLETPITGYLKLHSKNEEENMKEGTSTEILLNSNIEKDTTEETDTTELSDMTPTTEYLQVTTLEVNENSSMTNDTKEMNDKSSTQNDEPTDTLEQDLIKIKTQNNSSESITPAPVSPSHQSSLNTTLSNKSNSSNIKIAEKNFISGSPKHIFKDSLITYMQGIKLQRREDSSNTN